MPVKGSLPSRSIKYRGLFDMSQLLKAIRGWYKSGNFHVVEKNYKWKPGELEVETEGEIKYNEYFKYKIKVDLKSLDLKEVDVVKNGEKLKMQEGRITIDVSGEYELDYQKKFDGTPFLQALRNFYHKYIIKRTIEDWYEDVGTRKLFSLAAFIKEKLQFEENTAT